MGVGRGKGVSGGGGGGGGVEGNSRAVVKTVHSCAQSINSSEAVLTIIEWT